MNNTIYKFGENDWRVGKDVLIKPDKTYDTERIAYWQSEVHKNSCSLHGTLTVISNLTGIRFTLEERRELLQYAKDYKAKDGRGGFSEEWGWWMDLAVKCVVKWVKETKGIELKYYKVGWKQFRKLTYMGHGIVCGYRLRKNEDGVVEFAQDRFDNGEIGDGDYDYDGKMLYGHLVSFWALKKKGLARQMVYVDNYEGKHRYNVTKINHRGLKKLIETKTIFDNGYLITL